MEWKKRSFNKAIPPRQSSGIVAAAFARGAAKRPELAQPRLLDLHAGISNDEMQKVARTRFFLFREI